MSPEFSPLNPANRPNPLTGEGITSRYEQGDRGGQSGGEAQSSANKDAPADQTADVTPPKTGTLASDTFWRNRRATPLDDLFSDSLPWDKPSEPDTPATPPIKKGLAGPLAPRRPGTGPLGGPVRDTYSSTRAVQKTWAAHQASVQPPAESQPTATSPASPKLDATQPSLLSGLPTLPGPSPMPPRAPMGSRPPTVPPSAYGASHKQDPRSLHTRATGRGNSAHPTPPSADDSDAFDDVILPAKPQDDPSKTTGSLANPAMMPVDATPATDQYAEHRLSGVSGGRSNRNIKASLNRAAVVCQVTDVRNTPIEGANLEWVPLRNDMLPVINASTDSDGYYTAPNLAPGEYTLHTRSKGFIPHAENLNLLPNQTNAITVVIHKPSPE